MKSIEIDRSKRLVEEPQKGHNRWHPDIQPVIEVDQGEEVVFQTRDALDCQILPNWTSEDLGKMQTRGGPRPDRSGLRQGSQARRPPGGGVLGRHPRGHGLDLLRSGDRLPARLLPGVLSGALEHKGRLGHLSPDSRCPNPQRLLHGGVRDRALPCPDAGVQPAGDRAARSGRHIRPADGRLGGTQQGAHRQRGASHGAATGELRQRRHQAANQGLQAASSGERGWRPVFHRRRPLLPGATARCASPPWR